jgi:hypothetical protein
MSQIILMPGQIELAHGFGVSVSPMGERHGRNVVQISFGGNSFMQCVTTTKQARALAKLLVKASREADRK